MTDDLKTPCAKNSHLTHRDSTALVELTPRELVPDDWFSRASAGEGTEEARRLRWAKEACFLDCDHRVRVACLKMSLDQREEHGVWGGYDEKERHQLLEELDRRRNR